MSISTISISGDTLQKKIRELMPEVASSIKYRVLNKICNDPNNQPFLKWFCKNITCANILTPDEIRLKKHIKEKGEWLEGKALDAAVAEATKNCPELLRLLELNPTESDAQLEKELKAEQNAYNKDVDCFKTLEHSLKNLKDLGLKLDEDIEKANTQLELSQIRYNKAYTECTIALEEFDQSNRQLFKDIECLINTYADAFEKSEPIIAWTQVPLDSFIKQVEVHIEYLELYIKRHFGNKVEQNNDSDYGTLVNEERDQLRNEKVQELLSCQTNVTRSKKEEINVKVEELACSAMVDEVADIYNKSSNRIPQTEEQLRTEIAALMGRRDFLEENIALIRNTQLEDIVSRYGTLMISKILVDDGHARIRRKKDRLKKLEKVHNLACKKGPAHSNLLYFIVQLQLQRFREIIEFVTDARHYLVTEYSLSSVRSINMRQLQSEFDTVINSSTGVQNVFNKIFISLINKKITGPEALAMSMAIKEYDELIDRNEKRTKELFDVHLDRRITSLKILENDVNSIYAAEVGEGPTNTFKAAPYKLTTHLEESTKTVHELQEAIQKIRTQFKEMNSKISQDSFERDNTILWQRFLSNPEELQSKYYEKMEKVERSHFEDNSNV